MPAALFTAAIDALFADPNLATDATYRAGGADPGIPARVIVRRPDRVGEFGETSIVAETLLTDVRVCEVAAPAEGDTIELDGTVYDIQGEPVRDTELLVWSIAARPQ
jgi:hypothetical protein